MGENIVLRFWPLKGKCRLIGYPDAAYQNNEDKSSQRGQAIFIAEPRRKMPDGNTLVSPKGSLVDFETGKIKKQVLSTTVAELYAFMKCYGTCQFLRGLWMDLTGSVAEIHMRTDANNLVTTAGTTHLPDQKETIHMIQMLRHESLSGGIDDLAHVVSHDCLADCLTKTSAKPDFLIKAVNTGFLPNVDKHPPFRELMEGRHKAYFTALDEWRDMSLCEWICMYLSNVGKIEDFIGLPVQREILQLLTSVDWYSYND